MMVVCRTLFITALIMTSCIDMIETVLARKLVTVNLTANAITRFQFSQKIISGQ